MTEQPYASFRLTFAGNENVELTMGEGPDHGLYDVYIGGSLWQSFNGYAASSGARVIPIPLSNDGPFTLQVNNRADKGSASSGHVMRFKQLSVDAEYTLQTIQYTYDAASRVLDADYYPGENTASTPVQTFAYEYDIAGNLTDNNGTARTFNNLNQITGDSTHTYTFDMNGNLLQKILGSTPVETYVWDRANRLLSMGGHDYAYDGMGNRVSQTVSSVVTRYLLDVQPGLVQVIAASVDSNTESYVHSPRGIHAAQNADDDWRLTLQDGLGNVRGEIEAALGIGVVGAYEPYGIPMDIEGVNSQPFRFTGEMRDANALQYHRARYYYPALGVWLSQDLYEGEARKPLSLDSYIWVQGNPTNYRDSSGKICESWDALIFGFTGQCDEYDMSCPGTPRKPICLEVRKKFDLGIMPTYDELVRGCYACDPTISLLPTDQIAAYGKAIENAILDGIVSRENGDRYKQLFSGQHTNIPYPNNIYYFEDGYLEGVSTLAGVILGVTFGRELVYNFRTFQRSTFAYTGGGAGVFAEAGAAPYNGFIGGFVYDTSTKFEGGAFFGQYSGRSYVVSGSVSVPIPGVLLGAGLTYATGEATSYPSYVSLSGSLGLGVGIGAGVQLAWETISYPQGDRKSYIRRPECTVDLISLTHDIYNGDASPVQWQHLTVYNGRTKAVQIAEDRARDFELLYKGNCGC